jgi:hypothetical protein
MRAFDKPRDPDGDECQAEATYAIRIQSGITVAEERSLGTLDWTNAGPSERLLACFAWQQ